MLSDRHRTVSRESFFGGMMIITVISFAALIFGCTPGSEESPGTDTGTTDQPQPPPPFQSCADPRASSSLRISDGMLLFSDDGGPGRTPLFLAGSGSYELATDPAIVDGLTARYGAGVNVFSELLRSSSPEIPSGLNFYRMWIPGFSTASGEWGGGMLSEREEMPFVRQQNGRWDLSLFDEDGSLDGPSGRYFQRLRRILDDARAAGVIVQVTLFDHCMMKWLDIYDPISASVRSYRFWQHNPWNPWNNVNDLEDELPTDYPPFPQFYMTYEGAGSQARPKLRELQRRYVETIVQLTASYPNVFYEIMNQADNGSGIVLARWHLQVIRWIRALAPEKLVSISSFPLILFLENAAQSGTDDKEIRELLSAVDIICYHYSNVSWASDYLTCQADIETVKANHDQLFPGKIAMFDTDGAGGIAAPCRENNDHIADWAARVYSRGGSFNHKDYIYADPDAADETCTETGCGFRYDCVECGIDSIDHEAARVITESLSLHPPGNRGFRDAIFSSATREVTTFHISGVNTGTLPITPDTILLEYCSKTLISDLFSESVLPGESFSMTVPESSGGDRTFQLTRFEDQLVTFGTVFDVRIP